MLNSKRVKPVREGTRARNSFSSLVPASPLCPFSPPFSIFLISLFLSLPLLFRFFFQPLRVYRRHQFSVHLHPFPSHVSPSAHSGRIRVQVQDRSQKGGRRFSHRHNGSLFRDLFPRFADAREWPLETDARDLRIPSTRKIPASSIFSLVIVQLRLHCHSYLLFTPRETVDVSFISTCF